MPGKPSFFIPSRSDAAMAMARWRASMSEAYERMERPTVRKDESVTSIMLNCTGANAALMRSRLPLPNLVAYYSTGDGVVPWTAAERSLYPASIMVGIDQGGHGSPDTGAVVRDVERGAWTVAAAVDLRNWHVGRPTIYCSRDTIPSLVSAGWHGEVWLAWPGWNGEVLPESDKLHYVAVQNEFYTFYESSQILDETWPRHGDIIHHAASFSATVVFRAVDMAWSQYPGADHYVVLFRENPHDKGIEVANVPAHGEPQVIHEARISVAGMKHGVLSCYAIVNSKPISLGDRAI